MTLEYSNLKVEDFGFSSHIDEVRPPVQNHVGEKFGLVNLTRLDAGNSHPDRHVVFHQIGKIVIGAIAGAGFFIEMPCFVGPHDPAVNKKNVCLMAL